MLNSAPGRDGTPQSLPAVRRCCDWSSGGPIAPKSNFDAVGVICGEAYGVAIETGAIDSGEWVHVKDRDGVGILSCQ